MIKAMRTSRTRLQPSAPRVLLGTVLGAACGLSLGYVVADQLGLFDRPTAVFVGEGSGRTRLFRVSDDWSWHLEAEGNRFVQRRIQVVRQDGKVVFSTAGEHNRMYQQHERGGWYLISVSYVLREERANPWRIVVRD